ncbi:hypothetical protein PT974_08368 [Cladobotryum mycophilum]|uniref:RING-type domain-containing protein n=1 Tax=Cladobotryum mycophilum TaxID=491253 RepID=A0ABR0SD72_9HYPO
MTGTLIAQLSTGGTFQICKELLYRPLTLLDCLHTSCGACLKAWFQFQAEKAEKAPTPPTPDTVIFTCPACRSRVRDTKHNATVATLLEMYTAANPGKDRSDADKQEMAAKYKPGDQILPKVKVRERTAEEKRLEEEDERVMEEVRQQSLREAVAVSMQSSRARHRGDSRSGDERPRSSRDHRSDSNQRQPRDGSHHRRTTENGGRGRGDHLTADGHHRRPSDSTQRQVEHQSSLRSLIGSQMSERDIEREIEEFARQIQEEGLLDGLDLDNIDLSRDDELSRRITEAYRRRQRDRSRQEPARRSNASARSNVSRLTDSSQVDPRLRSVSRPQSRPRTHSRSTSGVEGAEDRSRPPLSSSANLEVRDSERRTRRRTTSGSRSSTTPTPSTVSDARPAARSQTDLTLRTQSSDPTASVPTIGRPGRSSSLDAVPTSTQPVELPAISSRANASFADRLPQNNPMIATTITVSPDVVELPATRPSRLNRPTDLILGDTSSLVPSPLVTPTSRRHQRSRSQIYEEPSITCARCDKPHIEYDLHYNCKICNDGQWNICQDCYRTGKGCLYWFGFGYGAWKKWEKKQKQGDDSAPMPHILTAARYLRPPSTSINSDTGKTMVSDDPKLRLQSGTFCAKCFTWTNECYWRCDVCNEGEWGFCNDCVNQGKSCSHKLLPLAHEITSASQGIPRSPRSPGRPTAASMLSGPQIAGIGPFKPLTFNTRCDVCKESISPSKTRFHCFSCTSTLVPDASQGDYDICSPCYGKLEAQGRISKENGQSGWRRCLHGHRMAIVGFVDGKIGQWRYVERDLVGGRALRSESVESSEHSGLQKWSWQQGSEKLERLVTKDVSKSAPTTLGSTTFSQVFPPDGGAGLRAHAMWAWYPKPGAEDELLFPRGADIKEIKDINGDWFFGTYMGAKGLFPAPYVRADRG